MLCDTNGYIQIPEDCGESVRTLDSDGYPVRYELSWSEPIPCQWRTKIWSNTSESQGEAVVYAQYSILIEWLPDLPTPERVRLLDNHYKGQASDSEGIELQVIEARPLRAVRKYLIKAK